MAIRNIEKVSISQIFWLIHRIRKLKEIKRLNLRLQHRPTRHHRPVHLRQAYRQELRRQLSLLTKIIVREGGIVNLLGSSLSVIDLDYL